MRITQQNATNAISTSIKKRRAQASSGFFSLEGEGGVDANMSLSSSGPGISVGGVSVLLAMQATQSLPGERETIEIERGHALLDQLDELKLGVLSGRVSQRSMNQLLTLVEKEREEIENPTLKSILDHIDLRARVELAKLERQRS